MDAIDIITATAAVLLILVGILVIALQMWSNQ